MVASVAARCAGPFRLESRIVLSHRPGRGPAHSTPGTGRRLKRPAMPGSRRRSVPQSGVEPATCASSDLPAHSEGSTAHIFVGADCTDADVEGPIVLARGLAPHAGSILLTTHASRSLSLTRICALGRIKQGAPYGLGASRRRRSGRRRGVARLNHAKNGNGPSASSCTRSGDS